MNTARDPDTALKAIAAHFKAVSGLHLRDQFATDPGRAGRFTIEVGPLAVDYSKNRIFDETIDLLVDLAESRNLAGSIQDLFSGAPVNRSENRPALHVALRAPGPDTLPIPDGTYAQVEAERERMFSFIERIHAGKIGGAGGKPFMTVVNIGIGGSDLGPKLCAHALSGLHVPQLRFAFIANVHGEDIYPVLERADPASTLFVVASKSFTTTETLRNAHIARAWLQDHGVDEPMRQFVGISANEAAALEFGIDPSQFFRIWDWVGGRYSLWSAIGFTAATAVGPGRFRELLAGAHEMDLHFLNAPFHRNIPVILGLLDVWYGRFFGAQTHAVVPYDERLRLLPDYLGQLIMESNGKSVTAHGEALAHTSAPVVWGGVGTPAQHAFFQMLHQGTHLVPLDFLLPLGSRFDTAHHEHLVASCLAQGAALMNGDPNPDEPHRHFPGNRPSTTITYPDMTPRVLGMILAMYEHATFVHAAVSQINPFDQWGVELGKRLTGEILSAAPGGAGRDASTEALLARYRKHRENG